jgi:hypothetical protein
MDLMDLVDDMEMSCSVIRGFSLPSCFIRGPARGHSGTWVLESVFL